jgi:hypothetical protein
VTTDLLGPPWQRLPAELGPALAGRLEPTVLDVARRVTASVPVFAAIDDPKLARDVHAAVRVAVERFVELVGTGAPALLPGVREAFVALGAAEARDERAPDALLSALRVASRLLLRAATEALAEVRAVGVGEALDLSDAVTVFVDELAAACTDGYALQVREQAGEGDRRRRALAELLLRGGAPSAVVQEAAAAVGWGGLDDVVPVLLPPEQARDARFRYAADGVVLDRDRDALLLLRAGPRTTRERLVEGLRDRGAVVGPRLAWPRVPAAVRLAEAAGRVVRTADGTAAAGPPVFADDHLAALALRGEPGALDVLADRRLAPLDAVRDGTRARLLETLAAWLRHWGSRPDAAAALFVHPQTVSYRMRRLRALFGDALDDPAARLELLLVLEALGPRGSTTD